MQACGSPRKLENERINYQTLERKYNQRTSVLSRTLIFLLIPIFAALFYALLFKKRKYLVEHAVVATHFCSPSDLSGHVESELGPPSAAALVSALADGGESPPQAVTREDHTPKRSAPYSVLCIEPAALVTASLPVIIENRRLGAGCSSANPPNPIRST